MPCPFTAPGCDGSAEPQANILEVFATFNKGQVWVTLVTFSQKD